MKPHRSASRLSGARALTDAFFTRFFDNDITAGSHGLKAAFFSLVGFLAAPGFILALLMMSRWNYVALVRGTDALREVTFSSKVLYLYFGMIAASALAATSWNSLLLDRRDALVLGTLPVRPRTIVLAKIASLWAWLGLLTLAMHGLSSVSFGVLLAARNTVTFLARGVLAHFVAATAASVFVFLVVIAVQGIVLVAVGPRVFKRLSALLQVALVAGVILSPMLLPQIITSTLDRGPVMRLQDPWVLGVPPYWFLGTYEWVLGTDDPTLVRLHETGVLVLAVLAVSTIPIYALGYRRVAAVSVETGDAIRPGRGSAVIEWIARLLARQPARRATVQFFLASIARVDRLRFIVAVTAGVVAGWSGPLLYYWSPAMTGPEMGGVLAVSFADMVFLVAGLRIAAAMPSDLPASWVIDVTQPPQEMLRSGIWRALFAIGVVPVAVVFALLFGYRWNVWFGMAHFVVMMLAGAFVTELLLWNYEQMSCAKPWRPENASAGKRWPLYVGAFMVFTMGLAVLEVSVAQSPLAAAAFMLALAIATPVLRFVYGRRLVLPPDNPDELGAPTVLRLD